MSKPITVSAIQITPVDGEKETNVEKMLRLLDMAGNRGYSTPGSPAPSPITVLKVRALDQ